MTIIEVLNDFDDKLKGSIKSQLDSKGITASGATKESLRSEIAPFKDTLFGRGFFSSVDFGRGAYKDGEDSGLYDKILAWVELRKYGINFEDEEEKESIASAIYTRMQESGSYKFRNKDKQTDVIESSINATLPGLLRQLTGVYVENIRDVIADYKKGL